MADTPIGCASRSAVAPGSSHKQNEGGPGRWDWVTKNPVLRTTALILAVTLAPGCNEEPAPVSAAKSFAAAVQRNDIKALIGLVDAQTVEYLESAAERAGDQIGGRRSVDAEEMLQIVDVDPRFAVVKAELVEQSDLGAQVRLVGADGKEHLIDLVTEDSIWKVRLPLPAAPVPETPES